jgi:hypothetical protein
MINCKTAADHLTICDVHCINPPGRNRALPVVQVLERCEEKIIAGGHHGGPAARNASRGDISDFPNLSPGRPFD